MEHGGDCFCAAGWVVWLGVSGRETSHCVLDLRFMANLLLHNAGVDFPIFYSQSRGLINTVMRYSRSHQQRIEASGLGALQVHALRNIDLEVNPGYRVGLVWRNGAGKTTLLRVFVWRL